MSARAAVREPAAFDWGLLVLVVALLGLGLVMLASASISMAANAMDAPFYYLVQQLVAVLAGLFVGMLMLSTPTAYWERLAPLLLLVALFLLAIVLVPGIGREVNGARRWIGVAGINLQVSEPARLMLLMYVAGYAVRYRDTLNRSLVDVIKPMAVVACVCGLLLLEPDFGAAVVMLSIVLGVLFVAGAPARYFSMLCVAVAVALAALALSSDYRLARLTGFTNP
jgi:cell division protein FtsW